MYLQKELKQNKKFGFGFGFINLVTFVNTTTIRRPWCICLWRLFMIMSYLTSQTVVFVIVIPIINFLTLAPTKYSHNNNNKET